jgi:hypothetical protein
MTGIYILKLVWLRDKMMRVDAFYIDRLDRYANKKEKKLKKRKTK